MIKLLPCEKVYPSKQKLGLPSKQEAKVGCFWRFLDNSIHWGICKMGYQLVRSSFHHNMVL